MLQNAQYETKNPILKYIIHKRVSSILNEIPENTKLLEAGCGEGYMTLHLVKKTKDITTIDIDQNNLNTAKRRVELKDVNFEHQNLLNLNWNKKFDTIVCSEVLEHVKMPQVILMNLNKVLNEKGIIVITIPNEKILRLGRRLLFPFKYKKMGEITGHKVDLNKKKLEKIMPKNFKLIKYARIPTPIVYLNEFFVFEKRGEQVVSHQ
jgi:2-polyprenyl-3-methyl-5-hydroxy-6-metoxy-1,4-benzoquinol methylase